MKTKQLVSLFLALLIFGTRVGYALNVHYCGDKIAAVSLAYNPVDCGMKTLGDAEVSKQTNLSKNPCCKDSILLFQNHESQKVQLITAPIVKILEADIVYQGITFFQKPISIPNEFSNWNPPPLNTDKLFIIQQSLIFYG